MEEFKRMQARLPVELHEWLRNSAFKRGISMNQIIIKSLKEAKEKHEKHA